jgi:hypothetical protein
MIPGSKVQVDTLPDTVSFLSNQQEEDRISRTTGRVRAEFESRVRQQTSKYRSLDVKEG